MAGEQMDRAGAETGPAHPQALTRRNMRDFDRADRRDGTQRKEEPVIDKTSGREHRTSNDPGDELGANKLQFQGKSSEGAREVPAWLEAQQRRRDEYESRPPPAPKQRLDQEKANRLKMSEHELVAEKGAKRKRGHEDLEEVRRRRNSAHEPPRQQPGASSHGVPIYSKDTKVQPPDSSTRPQAQPTDIVSLFPPEFPRFQSVQNVNDIGAYLANASYIVSVGGPPVSDLKYGVVLVPVGEERLLFGKQPHNEMPQALEGPTPEAGGQPQPLHALDEDSAQFQRPRFASRGHNTESISSPVLQSPAQNTPADVCAVSNGKAGTDTRELRNSAMDSTADVDGDTEMGEASGLAQDGTEEPEAFSKKVGQGLTATTAPARTRPGSSKRPATKPHSVVAKTAPGLEALLSAGNPANQRALRPRKPLPGSASRAYIRS